MTLSSVFRSAKFAMLVCGALFLSDTAAAEPIKAAHFVLGPSSPDAVAVRYEDAVRILEQVDELGFNTIVLQIANGVKFDAAPELVRPGAWHRDQLRQFAEMARSRGLDIVPEFKFLTHQEKFLGPKYPELLYNAVTYDPRQDAVYEIVFAVIEEVVELIDPKAISIGHDEVVGWNRHHEKKHLRAGETMLPAELFIKDVNILHEFLEERKIETWMWGDMLLSPGEFPGHDSTNFHGNREGYGKELRAEIPRSVIICDWHYKSVGEEFPSTTAFIEEGFRVIGVVWEDERTVQNFSEYVAGTTVLGMMATTWYYVPQRRFDHVDIILRRAAEAFRVLDEKQD